MVISRVLPHSLKQELMRTNEIRTGKRLHSHKSNVINNGYYRYRVTNKPDPGFAHWQCVRLLIKAGAKVNVRDRLEHRRTPLHEAVESNHDVCVVYLIEAGADVNAVDVYGDSPLVQCADLGNITCLKKLIGAGADLNKTNNHKQTALQKAASKGSDNHRRCLELLIEAGADVNKPDLNGLTPLMSSAIGCGLVNETDQIKILLSAGASVNKRDMYNQTALELHISSRHYFVDILPDSGNETAHLLIVAGERIDGTTVQIRDPRGQVTGHALGPAEIIPRDPLCLKNICRETIRKRLIDADPYTNLFHKIPQLPLPPVLHSYLLYEESLDRLKGSFKTRF